jgi:hypothetical protein
MLSHTGAPERHSQMQPGPEVQSTGPDHHLNGEVLVLDYEALLKIIRASS